MIIFLNRIISKIERTYRTRYFKAFTHNRGKKVNIVGKIAVINPNVKCGNNVTIYPDVLLYGDGIIELGDNVTLGNGTIIYASKNGGVHIGENTMVAAQCYLTDTDHGIKAGAPIINQENTVSPTFVGRDAWLAAGCKVLKGSRIGDGAIVGAAAVVKGEIPDNAIAVGIPAKVKKYRS